jgi:glycosyltransferase involved in cell wall biosynthesis
MIIHGSGVVLDLFPFSDEPRGICCVSMACRLLKEKGINEFIEAAKILHDRNVLVNMNLYGSVDHGNPSSLTMLEMSQIKDSAHVNFLGYSESISEVYIASHIVCLPSYREGLPKSLIEGAACGRAIVTTDVPGCRKAIIPNVSGLLVPKQDPMSLANAIQFLVENPSIRMKMGQRGRAYCKSNFGINRIVDAHLEIYKELISKRSEVQ